MWSFGHHSLRLPRDFLNHYTLLEFFALRERYYEEQDHWPAQIVAMIRNVNRHDQNDKGLDPLTIMRAKRHRVAKQGRKSLVNPDLRSKLRQYAAAKNAFAEKGKRPAFPSHIPDIFKPRVKK